MKLSNLVFLSCCCIVLNLNAQQPFQLTEGTITFEKTINKFALIERIVKNRSNSMKEEYQKYKLSNTQFLTLNSTLSFSDEKTIFTPLEDANDRSQNWFNGQIITDQINTVYNDLSSGRTVVQKEVLSTTFLVRDSIRTIKWKITDETRDIAGYTCRRANGLVMDSIYIVAFFTNKIPISSGPESFSGLPGMILGVALPYENVTWFATKVTEKRNEIMVKPPVKGKPVSFKELSILIEKNYKDYEGQGQFYQKKFLL